MSSPASVFEAQSPVNDSLGDVERRLMRVKVLYTVDDQHKQNHLARLPDALPIPVVAVENGGLIGVVELRTCIQAIVSSSPELMPKLEQDFTVYAYDYSEYEDPLVGQGMLSRVLAAASPHGPASQSGTMITGRICKNMLGIFNNGVKETLEVKIKLVPVPIKVQGEYDRAMNSYRSSFNMDGQEFDSDLGQSIGSFNNTNTHNAHNAHNRASIGGGIDMLHDMLTPNFTNNGDPFDEILSQGSRPGSATPSIAPVAQNMGTQNFDISNFDISRPASRASARMTQNDPFIEDSVEEGPARKRARLMQADWQGRSNFSGRADSLRVAATTTGSIRTFRPSNNAAISNELGPRAPTPRPSEKNRKPSVSQPSGLRRASFTDNNSPAPMSDTTMYDDDQYSQASSPANMNFASSPPPIYLQHDFAAPSSPLANHFNLDTDSGFQSDIPTDLPMPPSDLPVPPSIETVNSKQPTLKRKPSRMKSLANSDWAVSIPSDYGDGPYVQSTVDAVSQNRARNAVLGATTSPKRARKSRPKKKTTTPTGTPPGEQIGVDNVPQAAGYFDQAFTSNNHNGSNTPFETVAESIETANKETTSIESSNSRQQNMNSSATAVGSPREGSLGPLSATVTLPPVGQRNPLINKGKRPRGKAVFPRSSTWAHPSSDVDGFNLNSDAHFPDQAGTPEPQGIDLDNTKPRSGSGAVRQRTIVTQLHKSIAAGDPVKFCSNCGCINPPTWRPYWIRVEYGTGENVECGAETGIHCVHPVTKDKAGKVLTYRVYKQWAHLTTEEKDSQMFQQLTLCNSCGDYLRKHKEHRPEKFWNPNQAPPKPQQPRVRKKKTNNVAVPSSDVPLEPAAPANHLETNSNPAEIAETFNQLLGEASNEMGPPPPKDLEWDVEEDVLLALQRAIQQSPARIVGSRESPIEVTDRTPDPARRVLFPSPRKPGEFRSLEDSLSPKSLRPTLNDEDALPGQDNTKDTTQNLTVISMEFEEPDKENYPPGSDDGLASLFDFDGAVEQSPRRSHSHVLRTPTKPKTPGRTPLAAIPSDVEPSNFLLLTPARQIVAASSPLPGHVHTATGLTPFVGNQTFYTDDFTLSPNWLKNFQTPNAVKNDAGFEFDQQFFNSLSSDQPMSSSPGMGATFTNFFNFYEDSTATSSAQIEEFDEANEQQTEGLPSTNLAELENNVS